MWKRERRARGGRAPRSVVTSFMTEAGFMGGIGGATTSGAPPSTGSTTTPTALRRHAGARERVAPRARASRVRRGRAQGQAAGRARPARRIITAAASASTMASPRVPRASSNSRVVDHVRRHEVHRVADRAQQHAALERDREGARRESGIVGRDLERPDHAEVAEVAHAADGARAAPPARRSAPPCARWRRSRRRARRGRAPRTRRGRRARCRCTSASAGSRGAASSS